MNTTYFRKNTFIIEREVSPEITQVLLKHAFRLIDHSKSVIVIAHELSKGDSMSQELSQQIETYGKTILLHAYRTLYFAHYLQSNPFNDVLRAFLRQYINVITVYIEAVRTFQQSTGYNK